jgi:NADH-quinone oxidoreductase subunit L
LLTHAFFKAGLFLAAGSVIHAVHTQNMHEMGGLRKALPHTYLTYLICAAALSGVPLLSGFLSKETILAGAFGWADQRNGIAQLLPITLLLSSGLTAVYMARQIRLIFFGQPASSNVAAPHEPDWLMRGPVWFLTILSVGFWFSLNPLSAHHSWVGQVVGPLPEGGPVWLAPASVLLVGLGGWLGFRLREPAATSQLALASQQYGYLDQLYRQVVTGPSLWLASLVNRTDRRVIDGVVDGVGFGTVMLAHFARFVDRFGVDGVVNGAGKVAVGVGQLTRSVQGGQIQTYIATAVAVVVLLLWWIL